MKARQQRPNAESFVYYGLRILQRVSLLAVIGGTIIHWVMLLVIATNVAWLHQLKNYDGYRDPEALNTTINKVPEVLSGSVVQWAVIAAALTFVALLVPRYRRYDKRFIVDSIVVITFCVVSVALSQVLVRAFITKYLLIV